MKRSFLLLLLCFTVLLSQAQTLGGNTVFNFLNQPNTSQLSALGGVNITNISNDVSMSFQNPALLRTQMNQQLSASFNNFYAGVKNASLVSAWHLDKSNTNIAAGINYLDYGSITQTDAAGNIFGTFRPNDYVVQVSASHAYKDHWWIGTTMKFISSNYAQYKSNGLALDIGLNYYDSSNYFQAGFVIKNMGTQLKTYDGAGKEELPFDIELGITKRLLHAPIQFSLTAHHLQAFNTYYNDTTFNTAEGIDNAAGKKFTAEKILSHLVAAVQFYIDEKIEATVGYNFSRRFDLNVYNATNGLNGFTMGLGVLLKKLHIRYATGFYQQNMFHQFTLNLNWKGDDL
ncbi:MAG: type IX secretion system protein PorQ [Bacteroidota bacterium]|nr:type IX secretion system protein PorQ [Bacteroidota bacterium]